MGLSQSWQTKTSQGTTYEIYKCIQALNLLGISWPSVMEYLNKDMVHQTHQWIWQLKVKKPVIALSKLD